MLFTKKFGWVQAGQGQRNVTVWKLVSWNVDGFQVCLFFVFLFLVYVLWYAICGSFCEWGIVVIFVVV